MNIILVIMLLLAALAVGVTVGILIKWDNYERQLDDVRDEEISDIVHKKD